LAVEPDGDSPPEVTEEPAAEDRDTPPPNAIGTEPPKTGGTQRPSGDHIKPYPVRLKRIDYHVFRAMVLYLVKETGRDKARVVYGAVRLRFEAEGGGEE